MSGIEVNPELNELHEHYLFEAAKGQEPLRVDKFLMNFIENATRNKIQQAAKNGNIWVDGHPVKSNFKVKSGQKVQVLFEHPPHEFMLVAEEIPLDIVFEDQHLMVVNKKAGMVVHPGHGNYSGTLVNAILHHVKEELPMNSSDRPGLVHRIDKDTSGLLVVAKTELAMTHLAKQFLDKSIERKYIALVWGDVQEESGTVEGHIGRSLKNRLQMDVFEDGSMGKRAITHFTKIESLGYVSLISCRLETGRTHQIRAHMKHIGHPLFNDERYGGNRILKGTSFTKYKQFVENTFKLLSRQALHAESLGFIHPHSGEKMYFTAELPEDFSACLTKWREYIQNRPL